MTSLASERSWLLDPGLLKLVHQCRRLIHTEFGVKLHLTEEHLEKQLASYASKTRSSHLVRTWESLKEQVPQLKLEEETTEGEVEDTPKRMYRGQVIAESEPETKAAAPTPEELARKKKVIYRGQVIG
ncbi:hypothetical protein D777_03459 [Marinobacter nitratireducens]|uniref:Uncharacterized protein n=1 Tax=Marinobacter nitratireducens TaxID=1137280 RepID=A0A072N006_9GAMM|nr:hypothetical protein [Marinobacter nitratireducens]KEF30283.1 hypothetical protein D777_03459 [Marinobacter nitratireducens]TNE94453.1 MAG: hypothetical protein EP328_11240 [Gammaproteobacteria bacterium]